MHASMTSFVPSVLPSSTKTTSQSGYVWRKTLSSASRRNAAALYAGTMTLMRGMLSRSIPFFGAQQLIVKRHHPIHHVFRGKALPYQPAVALAEEAAQLRIAHQIEQVRCSGFGIPWRDQ